MKMRSTGLSSLALVATMWLMPSSVQAAGENVGDTQRCVHLTHIKSSPVINDNTILVEMRKRGDYKRIDLTSTCSGLEFSGFEVRLHQDRLCTSDTVAVRQTAGAFCQIEKIVTIDEAEAKALRAQ
tara:strand:- start:14 stop:391 length:378 start_codon:yes stop_codon:yes gene_type:complete